MPDSTGAHDVQYDYAGFLQSHPRLTCYSRSCDGATLVAQPYMTQAIFDDKVREFLKVHPPKDGLINDADHRRAPLLVSELVK